MKIQLQFQHITSKLYYYPIGKKLQNGSTKIGNTSSSNDVFGISIAAIYSSTKNETTPTDFLEDFIA